MPKSKAIVITTINLPTQGVRKIAHGWPDWDLIVVGDRKTPSDWHYDGVTFLPFEKQPEVGRAFAEALPPDHYARKNLGYLAAIQQGAEIIAETDDDNIPYDTFLTSVDRCTRGAKSEVTGWENVYRFFCDSRIWPRGFPLELIMKSFREASVLSALEDFDCPIQQYLADGDPDVDAIYRLTNEGEIRFRSNVIVLGDGTFCPFNSQNTIWWPDAYILMYLPSYVSFRMTDIWRSLVAQVCLYKIGRCIAFRDATVFQERNEHSLIRDFRDEISGYLQNPRIMDLLLALPLSSERSQMGNNLRLCYSRLIEASIIPSEELALLDLWLDSVGRSMSASGIASK